VTIDEAVERVQFWYPQIYYACHTRHERRRSSAFHLSTRDSELLVHLDRSRPTSLSALAQHMDLARSTVSEAISRLEAHGYVSKAHRHDRDRRQIDLVLTARGVEAVRAASVLEAGRLRAVLAALPVRDLATVIAGLGHFAAACREAPARRRRRS
jgi:DNA-binding MarR family transcriptional regulator